MCMILIFSKVESIASGEIALNLPKGFYLPKIRTSGLVLKIAHISETLKIFNTHKN
jgi:hypothetical protein